MKFVTAFLLFILAGVATYAQNEAKLIAEIAATNDKAVKNAPFTAEAVSESVQVLADGNRIVRSSTSKLFRNSEGRFRREYSGGSVGLMDTYYFGGQGISIVDPIARQRLTLDTMEKTASVIQLDSATTLTMARGGRRLTPEEMAELEKKLASTSVSAEDRERIKSELKAGSGSFVYTTPTAPRAVIAGQGSGGVTGSGSFIYHSSAAEKYDVKTEELGSRDFEGVLAEGTRRVTTIPAGAIGNERPIETVYERWYSKELGIVIYTKQTDPRTGEQTYRVTNLVRTEPDPSLFKVPQGYRVLAEPRGVYNVSATPALAPRPAKPAKPARPIEVKVDNP